MAYDMNLPSHQPVTRTIIIMDISAIISKSNNTSNNNVSSPVAARLFKATRL
jgi:hypothetical protein